MSQRKDDSIDAIYKKVGATKARLLQADEHIKTLGEGAQKVGLSIDGAMLELNALLKQLFLCSQHGLPEYDILHAELAKHLQNIATIANTEFGRVKRRDQKETH
jgi:hypothetical protein